VAISAAANVKGIASIIHSINRLAVELLAQGFFIRGAIVKHHLYHDDKMVFGNALIQAYRIETSVVRFPRVMVTRSVVQDITAIDDKTASVLLRRSDDGPMFVHVLRAIEMEMLAVDYGKGKPRLRFDDQKFGGKLDRYVVIAERIQRRFDEATDNPNHFEKAKWFANYWNDTIQEWNIEGFKRITGPGLDLRYATWADQFSSRFCVKIKVRSDPRGHEPTVTSLEQLPGPRPAFVEHPVIFQPTLFFVRKALSFDFDFFPAHGQRFSETVLIECVW
jgi:hypothetical protein